MSLKVNKIHYFKMKSW